MTSPSLIKDADKEEVKEEKSKLMFKKSFKECSQGVLPQGKLWLVEDVDKTPKNSSSPNFDAVLEFPEAQEMTPFNKKNESLKAT